ncbi:MAG: hypothetical protein ABW003_20885 [Microvirga sp.]
MKKAADYQSHAEEWWDLAKRMDVPHLRDQLLNMAKIWEDLAAQRASFIGEYPQFAVHQDDPSEPNGGQR